ncbi:hypothetical protein E2C01_041916 [Portunus trituberculatus]|uniref:Uncharacterized protein n=1 Tax=Portunus trituberculatus TaxID=210409 RepID=A0A5B7FSA1_PORTR|nr:hypothetical protein [Portunus trituberculatus]
MSSRLKAPMTVVSTQISGLTSLLFLLQRIPATHSCSPTILTPLTALSPSCPQGLKEPVSPYFLPRYPKSWCFKRCDLWCCLSDVWGRGRLEGVMVLTVEEEEEKEEEN